jgi:hypothetical protein
MTRYRTAGIAVATMVVMGLTTVSMTAAVHVGSHKPLVRPVPLMLATIEGAPAQLPEFCKGERVPEKYAKRVVLAARSATVSSGGSVFTRLFNGLQRPIGLGRRHLQRYQHGRWERVSPSSLPGGAKPIFEPASRGMLAARSADECRSVRVGSDRAPGRYRVLNEVYLDLRPGKKPRIRTAEFRIE